jgi:hypothetical protein
VESVTNILSKCNKILYYALDKRNEELFNRIKHENDKISHAFAPGGFHRRCLGQLEFLICIRLYKLLMLPVLLLRYITVALIH